MHIDLTCMADKIILDETVNIPTAGRPELHALLDADPQIQQLHEQAKALKVVNIETLGESSDLLKEIKRKRQQLLDAHKKEKAPSLEQGRAIDRKYKVPRQLMTKSILALDKTIETYLAGEERKATAAQLEEDKWLRDENAKAMAYAKATGAAPVLPIPKILPQVPKRVETGVSSTAFIKKKKWRLPEVSQGQEKTISRDDARGGNLPDKFFVLDPAAVERARQAGEHVPNLEEFTNTRTMSR